MYRLFLTGLKVREATGREPIIQAITAVHSIEKISLKEAKDIIDDVRMNGNKRELNVITSKAERSRVAEILIEVPELQYLFTEVNQFPKPPSPASKPITEATLEAGGCSYKIHVEKLEHAGIRIQSGCTPHKADVPDDWMFGTKDVREFAYELLALCGDESDDSDF